MQNDILPQDEAMDAFRKLFLQPLYKAEVNKDGTVMKFQINNDRLAARMLLYAHRIITANRLPLQVDVEEWKLAGYVFDRWIVIEFVNILTPQPCY